jgi:L-iditol 2-dehydrogenase
MNKTMTKVVLKEKKRLEFETAEIPYPGPSEVLIKVMKVGVCGSDWTIYNGKHPYVKFPIVMGHEFAGIIAKTGKKVKKLSEGQRVTVIPHLTCGECDACAQEKYNFCESLRCTGAEADGAYAQYITMPEVMVVPIPDDMDMDKAAMIEPACVAYHGAKRGNIRNGDNVLVIGAGPIGIFCMQSCKALGAGRVLIADLDQWRLDIAAKLGADSVIDVSNTNLQKGVEELIGDDDKIDVFYDCVGESGKVLDDLIRIAKRGTHIVVIGVLQNEYEIPHLPDFVQHELRLSGTTMYVPEDYREMIKLMSDGRILTDGMLTHYFDLENIKDVYQMLEEKKEKYFKIMINVNKEGE